MKKILSLLLAVLSVLSISVTICALEPDEYAFTATVITCRYIETTGGYSFCAVGDVYENGRREPFTFSVRDEQIHFAEGDWDLAIDGGLVMGQVISVIFNGEVMESYPMQIVPNYIVVEEEIEEFADGELYNYLTMFYTEEWLIENGYMEVPPADGEEAPDENDTGSFVPDYDTDEYDSIDDEYSYVYGTPKAGDDAGECVMLTKHYLDGFVVMADVISNDVEGAKSFVNLYFLAYSNFDAEEIAPVRIDFEEDSLGMLGLKFSELTSGMNLRIYCDYGAYCVPVDGEKYYRIDGDVLTLEKLDGYTENYDEYMSYFFEMGTGTDEYVPDVYYGDVDSDENDVSDELPSAVVDVPVEEEILTDSALVEPSESNSAMTVLWIVVCGGITVVAAVMIILLLKKK